jgi:cholesterol transport system auxiliary component
MNRRSLLTVLAAGLALAGCGLSERPYVEKRDWPLTATRPADAPARLPARVLLIRSMQTGPGLESRGLASLKADGSVARDFYETWSVPPAEGAEAALRQWLTASGLFRAVLAPGSRLNADWVLESTLTALIADPPNRVARATLSVVVIDQRNGGPRILAQRVFTAEAPLGGTDAPALAGAMRAALGQVIGQVEQVLAELK